MKKVRNNFCFLLVFFFGTISCFAQNGFSFKRKLNGIQKEWHQLDIPADLYSKCKEDFSDIRIQGYTKKHDTINVPYFIENTLPQKDEKKVKFKVINESYRNDWYYFTLVCPTDVPVNNLELNFGENNFDWHVNLDAAEKPGDWVTILDDVRILAFHNDQSSYVFSKLKFSDSHFPYYRVSIHGTSKPNLKSVVLSYYENLPGSSVSYQINSFKTTEDVVKKESMVEFDLVAEMPVNSIQMFSKTSTDYFRKVRLEYLTDSVYSDSKWQYLYQPVLHSFISSDDYEPFEFQEIRAKKFRLIISNDDNEPVKFETVQVFGPQYRIFLRLNNFDADYYLLYGDKNKKAPVYDLLNFKSKIPKEPEKLVMGQELGEKMPLEEIPVTSNQNKIWLWIILISLVILLSFFSFKMLKHGNNN